MSFLNPSHQNDVDSEGKNVCFLENAKKKAKRTELCGTPQSDAAVKEGRKTKQGTDLKIKARPSSPHPDL